MYIPGVSLNKSCVYVQKNLIHIIYIIMLHHDTLEVI